MYRIKDDFLRDLQEETAVTARLLDVVTDEALACKVAPGHRSLRELAWHIVTAYGSILWQTGLAFRGPTRHDSAPDTSGAIAATYREVVRDTVDAIRQQWTDESLAATRPLYGEAWPNGRTVSVLLRHEIHHRGQLSVLLRQAGLVVPELYGPTKETAAAARSDRPDATGQGGSHS